MEAIIQARNLAFSYTGAPPYTLRDLNMTVDAGSYLSVVGENGSGKTTLMRLILRFLKPTGGMLETRAARVGYVPQKNDDVNGQFPITVFEMLDSYRRLLKIRDRHAVFETLDKVGMRGSERALMGTLSGGQGQKIRIARSLLGHPDLLILDEPSTGVDRGSQKEIYGLLTGLNCKTGMTIVSVEHNLEAAVANSTAIFHLAGGRGHICTPRQYAEEYLKTGGSDNGNASI